MPGTWPTAARWLGALLASLAAWLAASVIGDATASEATGLAAVYLPVGVAVVLLVRIPRYRPAVLLGVVAGALVIAGITEGDRGAALIGGVVNAVEALVVAVLILRWRADRLEAARDAAALGLAIVIGGLIGSVLGGLALEVAAGEPWTTTIQTWFAADVAGMMLIVPMLLAARGQLPSRRSAAGYLAILLVAVALSVVAVQVAPTTGDLGAFLAWYALLLMALLVGIRYGVTAMGVVQVPVALAAFAVVSDAPADEWFVRQSIAAVLAFSLLASTLAVRSELTRRVRSEALSRDMFERSPVATSRVRVPEPATVGSGVRIEILEANPAWLDLLGLDAGADLMRSVDPGDASALAAAMADPDHVADVEVGVIGRGTGRHLAIRLDGVLVQADGAPEGRQLVMVAQDVTEQRAAERALLQLARSDGLTGLLNRAAFEQAIGQRLLDPGCHPCGLVFVDLDRFKEVNDTHGHAVGDQALREVARRLVASVRPRDLAGRYGGDEFVVFAELDAEADLAVLARRVRRALQQPMELAGTRVASGASVGTALATVEDSAEDLLDRADRSMYRVKTGRSRSVAEE